MVKQSWLIKRLAGHRLVLFGLVVFGIPYSHAEPLSLSGSIDNRFSDNMSKVASDEQTDLETRLSLSIRHVKDPGKCNSSIDGRLGYGYWFEDTYDPEVYTDLGFVGDCELTTGLKWLVSDRLSDVTQSSQRPDVPDNSTRKNVFTTGPQYTLFLTRRDQLQVTLQYQNTEFEETQQSDSERAIASTAWNHLFSSTLTGGVSLSTNRAELDSGIEIDKNTANFTFAKTWSTTDLEGSLGVSEIETSFNSGSQKSDAVVGDLSLTREINPSADFFLNLSRELSDQTSDFDFQFGDFEFNLSETGGVEITALKTGIEKQFSDGTGLNLGLRGSRSDYLASENTEDKVGADLSLRRPLSARTSLSSGLRFDYLTYEEDESDDTILGFDIGVSYELSRDLGINMRAGHERRTSDIVSREYQENWVTIGLSYRFL